MKGNFLPVLWSLDPELLDTVKIYYGYGANLRYMCFYNTKVTRKFCTYYRLLNQYLSIHPEPPIWKLVTLKILSPFGSKRKIGQTFQTFQLNYQTLLTYLLRCSILHALIAKAMNTLLWKIFQTLVIRFGYDLVNTCISWTKC